MSGGFKVGQFNSQERAVSTDLNRMQAFKGNDIAEQMRFMLNVSVGTDDLDASGVVTESLTQGNPLLAEILNGFLVKPQGGSLNLLVDKGVLFTINPDGGADDSVYKYVRDAGVSVLGNLVITNNVGGGAIRIDVVEVQVADNVVETDNRDIFNPATGLFAATSVTKARADGLTYRVRAGTAGSGFPGTAQGWLPLAVISIPDAAASVDVMTFWDVRPLVNDREHAPSTMNRAAPLVTRCTYDLNTTVTAVLTGLCEVSANGRRLGGRFRRGSPGTDAESIDLSLAVNRESGFTLPGANGFTYLYLLTPAGLPRWARYTDGPAGRVPRSPRGIPVLSNVVPTSFTGVPSAAITLPTGLGLSGNTTSGVCVAAFGTKVGPAFLGNFCDGVVQWANYFGLVPNIVGTNAAGSATFVITDGTTHPANARALWVEFNILYGGATTAGESFDVTRPDGTVAMNIFLGSITGVTLQDRSMVRIPLTNGYPAITEAARSVVHRNNVAATPASSSLRILGWELGP